MYQLLLFQRNLPDIDRSYVQQYYASNLNKFHFVVRKMQNGRNIHIADNWGIHNKSIGSDYNLSQQYYAGNYIVQYFRRMIQNLSILADRICIL